jgi:hypothetical protein
VSDAGSPISIDPVVPAPPARCVCVHDDRLGRGLPAPVRHPRDPSRDTLGGAVAAVAAQLGTLLMPWQRLVADVAMELDPATGLLAYSEVDLTTPRQSGKTTLELAVLVHRCRTWARSRALYSAQSRIHAHKKWEAAGVEVVKPTTKARAAADSGFYDAVTDSRSLRYVPRPALDAAVAGAATRPLGDTWARKGLSVDICPLVAVSLAR